MSNPLRFPPKYQIQLRDAVRFQCSMVFFLNLNIEVEYLNSWLRQTISIWSKRALLGTRTIKVFAIELIKKHLRDHLEKTIRKAYFCFLFLENNHQIAIVN
jgi:hypothetical protein